MPQQDFKRNVAYKLRIGDLLIGKPIFEGEKFIQLELGDKRIVRVNIIGNIIERYDSPGEKRYSAVTIDDGSGQIKLKSFGDDVEKLKDFNQGQTVLVIGVLKSYQNETYVFPEIVKTYDPKYLLVRKIELEKATPVPVSNASKGAIRDKILETIKNSEEEGGVYVDKIIMDHREVSHEIINQELQKMLEEGIIFEPRPGKVRWLG